MKTTSSRDPNEIMMEIRKVFTPHPYNGKKLKKIFRAKKTDTAIEAKKKWSQIKSNIRRTSRYT